MAKIIDVGGGYSIQFHQRARGQETRYFEATVYKDGVAATSASSDGHGGPTLIRDRQVEIALEALVDTTAKALGLDPVTDVCKYERAGLVFAFAEIKGYTRSAKDATLATYIRGFADNMKALKAKYG